MHLWTKLYIYWKCKKIGEDLYGNSYFIETTKKLHHRVKRYVLFKKGCDASMIPSGWHAWMHYMSDETPIALSNNAQTYYGVNLVKNHCPNMTGTPFSHHLQYTTHNEDGSPKFQTYTAWTPL